MIAELDERELERLLHAAAESVDVPENGAAEVLRAARAQSPTGVTAVHARKNKQFWMSTFAAAAAIVLVVGVSIAALGGGRSSSSKSSEVAVAPNAAVPKGQIDQSGGAGAAGGTTSHGATWGSSEHLSLDRPTGLRNSTVEGSAKSDTGGNGILSSGTTPTTATSSGSADDSAKIVATGDTVFEVPKGSVNKAADAVIAVGKGAGGYVGDNKTTGGSSPSAQITLRVPYRAFDDTVAAIGRLATSLHGKVLSASSHSANVTAQFTDLQARRDAAVHARDQLNVVLARAQTIPDILSVNDRIKAVQTEIDQLTGQIRVLDNQASYSSLAVSISEKSTAPPPAPETAKPRTGMSKAWHDGGAGFVHGVEWMLSRSGGALIAVLALLALLFLVRYLYPVVRRGLL